MSTTHGLTGTRLYTIWNNIIGRCLHSNNPNYKNYGARGITVCEEWKNDVLAFVNWANENGYGDKLTIDRINNDGDYEPNNCRWVDYRTQAMNKRPAKRGPQPPRKYIWTINGIAKGGKDWCKEYGVSYQTVLYRINTIGIEPEQALRMSKIQPGRPRKEQADE